MLAQLPEGPLLSIIEWVPSKQRPQLRLVCKRFQALIDAALCPVLDVTDTAHLGGRPTRVPIYSSQLEFTMAAKRVLRQRAEGLKRLAVDFAAHGCVFGSQLLGQQPLPQLRCMALSNGEAQHVAALQVLPRLREVALSRHINGQVTAGPAAELLVAQLCGLPLDSLRLSGYRMQPGVLESIADALPGLQRLTLEVEIIEQGGRLKLAGLARLTQLGSWTLCLLGCRASAAEVCVAPLPSEATALRQLSSVSLGHVRAVPGEEQAVWSSLALLPGLRKLKYKQSGHVARQPPPELFRLTTASLTNLYISVDGAVCFGDLPSSTWSQLPELPAGALPRLARLRLDCVGLLDLPPSWCRLPAEELRISGLAWERSFYSLQLPGQLPALTPTLRRLELPSCGLLELPVQVLRLTGLTYLGLARNSLVRLPCMGALQRLRELELYGNPATNVATALQGCPMLRRLGLGSSQYARRCLAAGEYQVNADLAYEDVEAGRWQDAWLATVRVALPWVATVEASYGMD